MVDGSEGREFIVTIANGGPDTATGSVEVKAIAEFGDPIEGSPWTFHFNDEDVCADPSNDPDGECDDDVLAPDDLRSWTTFFTINLDARTTIEWTATITAADDVNPGNNVVTEETKVVVAGGSNKPQR
jgi:hypothetical protein